MIQRVTWFERDSGGGSTVHREPAGSAGAYRKRPVTVQAIRYDGEINLDGVLAWARGLGVAEDVMWHTSAGGFVIRTLEGDMRVNPGDWVVRGVQGEYYPVKPDIFSATYEPA